MKRAAPVSAAEGKKMEELDLWGLLNALLRRAWAIILLAVIGAGLAFGYTYFMVDPLYKASALLYVNNSKITMGSTGVSISASELSTAQRLVEREQTRPEKLIHELLKDIPCAFFAAVLAHKTDPVFDQHILPSD